jgi:hypothetical protein
MFSFRAMKLHPSEEENRKLKEALFERRMVEFGYD